MDREPQVEGSTSLDSVWHYTTAEGLQSIVSKNLLWATSHRFMNDSLEPRHATLLLQKAASAIRGTVPVEHQERFDKLMGYAERRGLEVFLLCAALEPDLLTVWRGYGASVPYAIELDASVQLLPVAQTLETSHPYPPTGWGPELVDEDEDDGPVYDVDPDNVRIEIQKWEPVDYDDQVAQTRVEFIAKLARQAPNPLSDALFPWSNLGGIDLLQLKNEAFRDEREARTIFEVSPRWKFVKHRPTRFGLTPYIEVSAVAKNNRREVRDNYLTEPAKLPIREVHIGPSPLGDESVEAVREFLEFNGYPDVLVKKSTTPFR